MDDMELLLEDLREGHFDAKRIGELIVTLQAKLQAAEKRLEEQAQRIEQQAQRIEELEGQAGASSSVKVDEPFCVRAEERRQEDRGKTKRRRKPKVRRGRMTTAEKIEQADRSEPVFPDGVDPSLCRLSHVRPVWRLENGRAVLIAYEIYRGPSNRYGKIPGVLGRSEFGMEIVVELAYLIYIIGLSFDKACQLLSFFQNLHLRKTQVDALLHRLARHWEDEFERLCQLLANSLVVYTDETSWSLNSVWAFLSEKARVLFFGVHKDGATLKTILDPESFAGVVVSDDAAVYANFSQSQKCWAHLLRKAIKLTLQDRDNQEYRTFTDQLLEIYRKACRLQRDRRFSGRGRAAKVAELHKELLELCYAKWCPLPTAQEGVAGDYGRLVNELFRLTLRDQLFTFVTASSAEQPNGEREAVGGTNNKSERTLRGSAQARKMGRTNKSLSGGRRQTILTSVLESLRVYLETFSLLSVMAEINRWVEVGQSCFTVLIEELEIPPAEESVLDQVLAVDTS